MKRNFPLSLFIFALFVLPSTLFGQAGKGWQLNPFEQRAFVENRGQFNAKSVIPGSTVHYGADNLGVKIYFSNKGISYAYERQEYIAGHKDNNSPAQARGKEEESRQIVYHVNNYSIEWVGANPNAKVTAHERTPGYYNYAMGRDAARAINFVPGYSKLVYHDLYPGIDLEYVFHAKEGLKYSFIVHPGADPSKINLKYTGEEPITIDTKGNIHLKTPYGDIVDHAPVSFFENGTSVASSYSHVNGVVSFALDDNQRSKIKNQKLIIDPWTVNPALTTVNKVYDIHKDGVGNVYAYGGSGPFKLVKYTALGAFSWSLNTPYSSWYGDLTVDGSGNAYIAQGWVNDISRVDPSGVLKWSATHGGVNEHWALTLNCGGSKLSAAGGCCVPFISIVDTANGIKNSTNNVGTGATDVRTLVAAANTNYYLITAANQIIAATNAYATLWQVATGYAWTYSGPAFITNGGSSGYGGRDAMDVSRTRIFTTNGGTVYKRNISNGAQLGTVAVPGGVVEGNDGICVDSCNNIYVGSSNAVVKFDSSLTQLTTATTSGAVYCVAMGTGGEILACGDGFIGSYALGACPLPTGSMSASVAGANSTCSSTNGSATASATGGSGAYTYSWSNGATTQTITGLSAGTYTVVVSDGTGCLFSNATVSITGGGLNLSTQANNILCNGQLTGSASVTSTGGQGSYTYSWSSGQTTQGVTGLAVGGYTVTVTDSAGCSTTQAFTITQPALLATTDSSNNILCNGNNAGSSFLVTSGGTGAYTYTWSNGSTTASITGLSAGTYSVVVSDANGCTVTRQVTIAQPSLLSLTATANNVNCTDDTLASASANANGGTSPYTYSWSNGATTASITGITAGSYTVMVTDANGCTSLQVVNVVINTKPKASISATPTSGQVPLSVVFTNGSTGGSTYSWIFGDGNSASTQNATNTYQQGGTFTVMMIVTASNGCKDTAYITIIADGFSTLIVPNVFSPNGDGTNDVFLIESIGLKDLTLEIYDRWGLLMSTITSVTGGWDGKAKSGSDAPEGTYYYILKANGIDNKQYDLKGYLMLLRD